MYWWDLVKNGPIQTGSVTKKVTIFPLSLPLRLLPTAIDFTRGNGRMGRKKGINELHGPVENALKSYAGFGPGRTSSCAISAGPAQ